MIRCHRRGSAPATADASGAVGYVRVSTLDQAEHGVSLDAQRERIEAYCAAQSLGLVAIVRENGVSGTRPLVERRGGAELLDRLRPRGTAAHVIALKLDRLFRDAADALHQTRAWDRAGIALHLIDVGGQTINTGTAMGRMFLTMMAGFAELERNLTAERTAAALRLKKARLEAYGPTPLGFDRAGDRLVPNAAEAAVVVRIEALRTAGLSTHGIAARLNADGVPTKRGRCWHASTVHYLLRNGLYQSEAE